MMCIFQPVFTDLLDFRIHDNTYAFFVARVVSGRVSGLYQMTSRPHIAIGPARLVWQIYYFTVTLIVAAIWPP